MEKLYDIQFDVIGDEITTHMYYRSDCILFSDYEGGRILSQNCNYDFFTYYNSLSIKKWRTYTNLEDFSLVIEAKGNFELHLFGHYKEKNGEIKKEYISRQKHTLDKKTQLIIDIPTNVLSSVVGFSIYPLSETIVYSACYMTKTNGIKSNEVRIALITPTYKKEEYIYANIRLLNNYLFSNKELSSFFHWFIVDNGRSIADTYKNKYISIVQNPNLGGAGGFARGMMEMIKSGEYTHALLMDDDVRMSPVTFRRIYYLLRYQREEYKANFISGAMIKMEHPNIQHEDVGIFDCDGSHHSAKPAMDLNLWDSIVNNEEFKYIDDLHYYAGWWFCCIPSKYIKEDNLPLPVFVRGDDVEFSIRNNPGFITMNGICIWHEGFENKFSGAMEFYQVERNDLIVCDLIGELDDIKVIERIETLFWEEIYKFNYLGASLLLDAVEDYLQGPDYTFCIDGFKTMKQKNNKDNKLIDFTDDIYHIIPENIYEWKPISRFVKFIYDYSYNGQARIPNFMIPKRKGVMPYGWGYYPGKICMTNENIAIDTIGKKYVVYKKNRNEFKKIVDRHKQIMNQYYLKKSEIKDKYLSSYKSQLGFDSWMKKIKIYSEKE
ncbi:MAG: glycosyltransferase [Lachnospiraceae bacterium]|nr:glycosyltransferase [Lachnospiraceae bacterium]